MHKHSYSNETIYCYLHKQYMRHLCIHSYTDIYQKHMRHYAHKVVYKFLENNIDILY